ncbi:MAG: PadR family transcriptional regulator [Meiothermus sp.]|uniref:PadR family transcriptional regulator n=1 Tax=Meiothermus sp. TaxID=1955249 RepID=UPI0025E7D330|nr:helix-turn-helix transcriptional regulator [Meiothermus sp.]MCS7067327.1 PadR family transcriptional regulator [Meiothermus sp.]MCX7600409.1 PadR family transcriptional regulator [Meiothermus sp.]MDW8424593.1 helix-turn-helix transcriptional regulator [Meiothermus sp.]
MGEAAIPKLSTTDWAVLAALLEQPSHGFRIAALFAPEGELGEIWRIQRTQVYRALEHLEARGLIEALRQEEGDAGPPRTLFTATSGGRALALRWLNTPVAQLRYGRSDLRLKIAFLIRLGLDLAPLLKAQKGVFAQILENLRHQPGAEGVHLVSVLWREEMAKASLEFIERLLARNVDLSK